MGGRHFRIGAAVADAHDAAVHGRQERAEGRSDDARNAAQPDQGTGHQGTGRARGDHRGDVVAVAQQDDGLHHRTVPLEPDHVGRFLIAADDFGGVDDLQAGGIVAFSGEFLLQKGFVARQDEMQFRIPGQRGQGPGDGGLRGMVAAEAVDEDLDHDSFFT